MSNRETLSAAINGHLKRLEAAVAKLASGLPGDLDAGVIMLLTADLDCLYRFWRMGPDTFETQAHWGWAQPAPEPERRLAPPEPRMAADPGEQWDRPPMRGRSYGPLPPHPRKGRVLPVEGPPMDRDWLATELGGEGNGQTR